TFRYYAFLWRRANEHSATVLEFSNDEIRESTGLRDHKTLSKARKDLVDLGLITVRRVPPGIFSCTLLSHTGEPIPPPRQRRGVRRYEAKSCEHPKSAVSYQEPATNRVGSGQIDGSSDCRIHGAARHWDRDGDAVCEICHPAPT